MPSVIPPWSAASPYANPLWSEGRDAIGRRPVSSAMFGSPKQARTTTPIISCSISARRRFRCSKASRSASFPPGADADGKPHHPRQYSVASPRNGERPGYNNVSLTVKRVLEDHQGRPCAVIVSNYLCDLDRRRHSRGDGPFGVSFLMPKPSEERDRDDLHRHGKRADARDDRVATPLAQVGQIRGRQADAVLRRPHQGGTAVFRAARQSAEGLHRHQLRLQPHARASPSATCRT